MGTLPKTLQMKGRQLLSAVTWNERGELIHKGVAIRAVTRSISFTIYCEIEKHPIPSDGSSSPTKCAPPTYPWNWSATSQGDYTCRRNAVNELRRNVPRDGMGDFINFLFDRYDRPSSSCHCHGAAAIETTPTLLRS